MTKQWSKQNLILQFMGIFIARASIGVISPIAISFFAAMYLDKRNRFLTIISVLIGITSSLPMLEVIKYSIIMITIMILVSLFEYNTKQISILPLSVLVGLITATLNLANGFLSDNLEHFIILALAEGIAVFAFTFILRQGLDPILFGRKGQSFNNEQIVSIGILLFAFIYGIPKINELELSIQVLVALFCILFIGYKYGAGYGAITGVACGAVLGMVSGDFSQIAIATMLGILSGTFREMGKLVVAIVFSISSIILFGFVNGMEINMNGLLSLVSGSIFFLILPDSIAYKVDSNVEGMVEDLFVQENIHNLTKGRLKDFSESFYNLASTFNSISEKKSSLNKEDKESLFNELSEQLCKECTQCDLCWNINSYDTYQGVDQIMDIVEKNGTIALSQVPENFSNRCIQLDRFLLETRRIFDLAKLNLSWYNRMAEGREAIAEQFSQVAYIIDDFSHGLYKPLTTTKEIEEKIIHQLKANYIIVQNIAIYEKRNQKQEIYIYASTRGGHCATTKEIASIISDVFGKSMKPSPKCKNVISKTPETFIFEEEANYKVLTGITRINKDGALLSGDNYSFIYPDSGTAVMTLSDGMGTGEKAYEYSESVVNLLEQFIEAGFSKESAVKLINGVMVIKSEEQAFSSVDMSVINLYTGICDFIKLGASTTFVKKEGKVDIIQSGALPLGMLNQLDYEVYSKKLQDGDYIIMVTDGVIDCIPGDEKESFLAGFIEKLNISNPKKVANAVLNYSLELNKWVPKDDMTVLVGGFWKKS